MQSMSNMQFNTFGTDLITAFFYCFFIKYKNLYELHYHE